ncbi:MAG TPA: CPBP family intramembrane metalloprotease domain-containing protein [Cytophagales bacterium]|nr:CPBP family intramembrane metalloprotease domain-containing protein [Cytophagales bacterium]HCR53191.1 CPBP family intramembrane metalloprotease domain-containing protein [Cytophagales bacterium]
MNRELSEHQRPAWISVILIFLTAMLGFVVIGPLIGVVIALPFIDGDLTGFLSKLGNPASYPELRIPLFIMQGCATLIGLILLPALYIRGIEDKNPLSLFRAKPIYMQSIMISALVVVLFMIPNSFFIDWNANLSMPDFLKEFEVWAREKEDRAAELTTYLTTFDTFNHFLIAFVVIAILPGIGEELVFRGMLQPELHRATGNIHAAIWISAIMFSAIHLQFFGFVPRMLLGVLFGYLYYWSGNIFIPMLAHFVNNGFSVLMIYLYQLEIIPINLESGEPASPFMVALFTIITFGLLLYLKKFHRENNSFAS